MQAAWGGNWERREVAMITANDQVWRCQGVTGISVEVDGGAAVHVEAYVTRARPLGFVCILGMDVIEALGGVTVGGGQ